MSLEKIEIPVPRLRPRVGAGVLFVALGAVAAFSAAVIREQHWQLLWMDNHPPVLGQGFDIGFGDGIIRRSTWLPRHIYRGPHPLAIAAGIVNIIVCIALAVLFLASVGFKKNFHQHIYLLVLCVPAVLLTTTSVLYSFILHGVSGRLNTYFLFAATSVYEDQNYSVLDRAGARFFGQYTNGDLDFESWTCGVARGVPLVPYNRPMLTGACAHATRGLWLQLPLWFALVAAVFAAWVSFRGLPGWRKGSQDGGEEGEREEALPSDSGRIRLP